MQSSLMFLGFIIRATGMRLNDTKGKAVKEWPIQKTIDKVMSFLGLVAFYR